MIYALGHISGAHLNPAVSLAFALARHFPWRLVGAYWVAQCLGAIAAALLLRASLGDVADVGATMPSGSDGQSFLWELVLTFFLMLVIMAVATDTRAVGEAAAIAVGGTVALGALVGGPVSGASMNPARSLGPALAAASSTRSGSTCSRRPSAPRSAPSPTGFCGGSTQGPQQAGATPSDAVSSIRRWSRVGRRAGPWPPDRSACAP